MTSQTNIANGSFANVGETYTCCVEPSTASQIHAVKSSEPAATSLPSGCQVTHSIPSVGPARVCTRDPFLEAQMHTAPARKSQSTHHQLLNVKRRLQAVSGLPSRPPVASFCPSPLNAKTATWTSACQLALHRNQQDCCERDTYGICVTMQLLSRRWRFLAFDLSHVRG